MKKKFLFAMAFLFAQLVFAESFVVDGVTFCINQYEGDYAGISKTIPAKTAIVCGLPSNQTKLKIPSKVKYKGKTYQVKEIFYASGVSIYKYGRELEVVEIEEGVEKIGFNAFFQCESLKTIYIPSSCVEIDLKAGLPHPDASGLHYSCNFESIVVAKGNKKYYSKDGILHDKKTGAVLFTPYKNKNK